MICIAKGCNQNSIEGKRYCNSHLCNYIKRDNIRCNNKIFRRDNCFIHAKYLWDKIGFFGLILSIIGVILTIIAIIFGNQIYYFIWGDINVDFKESKIKIINGKPYGFIEADNQLGKTLLYTNATLELFCKGINDMIEVDNNFKLEDEKEFLSQGTNKFYISSKNETLFIINQEGEQCIDAYYHLAKYVKINNTHGKLDKNMLFEIFDSGEIKVTEYGPNETINVNQCALCNISVVIKSSNLKNPIIKKDQSKLIVSKIKIVPYPTFYETWRFKNVPSRYFAKFGRLPSFSPCVNKSNCDIEFCEFLKEKYSIPIDCSSGSGIFQNKPLLEYVIINQSDCGLENNPESLINEGLRINSCHGGLKINKPKNISNLFTSNGWIYPEWKDSSKIHYLFDTSVEEGNKISIYFKDSKLFIKLIGTDGKYNVWVNNLSINHSWHNFYFSIDTYNKEVKFFFDKQQIASYNFPDINLIFPSTFYYGMDESFTYPGDFILDELLGFTRELNLEELQFIWENHTIQDIKTKRP